MMKVRITRMKSLVSAALVMASPSDHTHTHAPSWRHKHDLLLMASASFLSFKQASVRTPRLCSSKKKKRTYSHHIAHNSRRGRRRGNKTVVQNSSTLLPFILPVIFFTESEKWRVPETIYQQNVSRNVSVRVWTLWDFKERWSHVCEVRCRLVFKSVDVTTKNEAETEMIAYLNCYNKINRSLIDHNLCHHYGIRQKKLLITIMTNWITSVMMCYLNKIGTKYYKKNIRIDGLQ